MRKLTLLVVALSFLYFPASASALNLDAATLPDNWGDNNLYPYAYNFAANTYHPLDDMGVQYWRDNANVPPPGMAGYRPLIGIGHPTLWGGAYVNYIRLEPSADPQCAWVHDPEDAVLAWDVQAGGTYRLQGQFLLAGDDPANGLFSGSDGINYYIKKVDAGLVVTVLESGYLGIVNGIGQSFNFDRIVTLASTDWLYFGVDAYGADYYDWGHLTGSITNQSAVPLPAGVLLLGAGLARLLAHQRRRRLQA